MSRGRRGSRTRRLQGGDEQAAKNGAQNGSANPQKRSKKKAKPAVDETNFWSGSTAIPEAPDGIRLADQPAAVVRSLGPPPLNGRETISEHYFEAVYSRSVGLASALAAAGGLLDDAGDEPNG